MRRRNRTNPPGPSATAAAAGSGGRRLGGRDLGRNACGPATGRGGRFPAAAPVGTLGVTPRGDGEVDAMAQRRWEPHGEGPPANGGRPPDPSDRATRTP